MARAAIFLLVFIASSVITFASWLLVLIAIFEPGGALSLFIQQRTKGLDLVAVGAVVAVNVGIILTWIVSRRAGHK